MIAFAPLVIVTNLSNTGTAIEQRIFQAVSRWRNTGWDLPKHDLQYCPVFKIDALFKEQLGFHRTLYMAL